MAPSKLKMSQVAAAIQESDHYETPRSVWAHCLVGVPTDQKLFDPFYCRGLSEKLFKDLGYPVVPNPHPHETLVYEMKDSVIEAAKTADVIVTNPPFSCLEKALLDLKRIGKPFICVLPEACLANPEVYNLIETAWPDSGVLQLGRPKFIKQGVKLPSCNFQVIALVTDEVPYVEEESSDEDECLIYKQSSKRLRTAEADMTHHGTGDNIVGRNIVKVVQTE